LMVACFLLTAVCAPGGTTEEAVADAAAPEHDEDQPLSQEDIAAIASADIPAEDVAMLEDGSGADDKAAVSETPAAAPKRRLRLKRASPDIAPETAGAQDKKADNAGDQCLCIPVHPFHLCSPS
jgi:hypothetical protein